MYTYTNTLILIYLSQSCTSYLVEEVNDVMRMGKYGKRKDRPMRKTFKVVSAIEKKKI